MHYRQLDYLGGNLGKSGELVSQLLVISAMGQQKRLTFQNTDVSSFDCIILSKILDKLLANYNQKKNECVSTSWFYLAVVSNLNVVQFPIMFLYGIMCTTMPQQFLSDVFTFQIDRQDLWLLLSRISLDKECFISERTS